MAPWRHPHVRRYEKGFLLNRRALLQHPWGPTPTPPEFSALGTAGWTPIRKGRAEALPHPCSHPRRRSGRSPAFPYPPRGHMHNSKTVATEKEDISNELKQGPFLKSFDRFSLKTRYQAEISAGAESLAGPCEGSPVLQIRGRPRIPANFAKGIGGFWQLHVRRYGRVRRNTGSCRGRKSHSPAGLEHGRKPRCACRCRVLP